MQARDSESRDRITLIALVVASLMIVVMSGTGLVGGGRRVVREAVSPFQRALSAASRPVAGFLDGIFNAGRLRAENEKLREELKQLRAETQGTAGAKERIEELERLLQLPSTSQIQTVPARVIASRDSNVDFAAIIDAGRDKGVQQGMPVIDPDGLVGVVEDVTSSSARVRLLIDARSGVGARLAQTRDIGVVTGQDSPELALRLIDPRVRVAEGEPLITSGDVGGSALPPDIPIGRVSAVDRAHGGLEARILVEPAVDFSRLEYVKVLIWGGPSGAGPGQVGGA